MYPNYNHCTTLLILLVFIFTFIYTTHHVIMPLCLKLFKLISAIETYPNIFL